jgi:hypothetical protein
MPPSMAPAQPSGWQVDGFRPQPGAAVLEAESLRSTSDVLLVRTLAALKEGYPHKGLTCDAARLRTPSSRAKEQFVPFLLTSRESRRLEGRAARHAPSGPAARFSEACRRAPFCAAPRPYVCHTT